MSDMGLTRNRMHSCIRKPGTMRALSVSGGAFILAAMLVPAAATAQQQDLSQCLAITDIAERVQCYDAIAQSLVQSGGAAAAPAPGPVAAAPVRPVQPVAPPVTAAPAVAQPALPTFGLSAAQRESQRNPEVREESELRASVAAVEPAGAGYWRFELSDGTLWELTERRRNFRVPRVGDDITIRRGSLGAFYLDADRQPIIRIRRIV